MRSQIVAAAVSLIAFIAGAAFALTASYGTQVGWWHYETGLRILVPGVALGLLGTATGGLWLTRALRLNNSTGWKLGVIGFSGSLLLAGIPLNQLRLYLISPPIHDVSTDIEYAPPFVALLPLRTGAENGPDYDGAKVITYRGKKMTVGYAQKKTYPDIKSAALLSKPAVVFWRGFEAAKRMDWNIVYFSEKDGRIEATDTSFWFGLVTDISIRVKPAGTMGARLDIRAESRTGDNDMGATAQLVRDYLKSLK